MKPENTNSLYTVIDEIIELPLPMLYRDGPECRGSLPNRAQRICRGQTGNEGNRSHTYPLQYNRHMLDFPLHQKAKLLFCLSHLALPPTGQRGMRQISQKKGKRSTYQYTWPRYNEVCQQPTKKGRRFNHNRDQV